MARIGAMNTRRWLLRAALVAVLLALVIGLAAPSVSADPPPDIKKFDKTDLVFIKGDPWDHPKSPGIWSTCLQSISQVLFRTGMFTECRVSERESSRGVETPERRAKESHYAARTSNHRSSETVAGR